MTYQRRNVSIGDVDAFLDKGVLCESVLELLLKVARENLSRDAMIHQPHQVRKCKTGVENILAGPSVHPRLQVFPYRSQSKLWGFFIVRKAQDRYELRSVLPEGCPPEVFEWATQHLRYISLEVQRWT